MTYTSAMADLLSRHGFRRFTMSRTKVGHLSLRGHIDGRPVDIVLDTGAGKTFVELGYCRSEGIDVIDTGQPGAPPAGATSGAVSNVFKLGDVALTLDGMPVQTDGIFAIDMSFTNQKLAKRGVEPIRAVIGQDVLRYHRAVIDYATLALFLKEEPLPAADPGQSPAGPASG
jgi:hypothetical protein